MQPWITSILRNLVCQLLCPDHQLSLENINSTMCNLTQLKTQSSETQEKQTNNWAKSQVPCLLFLMVIVVLTRIPRYCRKVARDLDCISRSLEIHLSLQCLTSKQTKQDIF